MAAGVSTELVKIGLELRKRQKLVLASSFLVFFVPAFVLLAGFFGLKSANAITVVVFSVAIALPPLLAAEAAMLLPVKAMQHNLEKNPTQTIEAACPPEKAIARVLRVSSERKLQVHDLKQFSQGREGFVLGLIGAAPRPGVETLFCLDPMLAVDLKPSPGGNAVAVIYHEGDSRGMTLAEVIKAKLKVA